MAEIRPGTRVLIVEDQAVIALALEDSLNAAGCACNTAYNSSNAIRLALLNRPDAIVMDVGIGDEIDGIGIALILRANGIASPVIFVTAYNDAQTMARVHEIERSCLLAKPIMPGQLEAALARAVTSACESAPCGPTSRDD